MIHTSRGLPFILTNGHESGPPNIRQPDRGGVSPSRVASWVCLVWALIGLMGVPESAAAAGAGGKDGNAAGKGDVGFILLNSEDTTPPSIRVGDAHVAEGDSGVSELVFPIEVRGQLLTPITLAWATTNGTAVFPDDFAASSGSVSIAAGVRNAEIRVPIVTDMIEEVNEAFLLGIALGPESTGAATLVDRTAAGVIMNDDGLRDRVQRFEWSVPSGVKRPGEPIAVELRAIDGFGQVVSNFSGSVSLGAVRLGRPTDSGHPSPLVIAEIHQFRTGQLVEVWNTSGQDLDISGWKVWIYENFQWPLPQQSFVFSSGTVIPANTPFVLEAGQSQGGLSFLIPSPQWGPAWNGPVPVAELCIGVLLQKDTGEVVDYFGAGRADPRLIRVPLALEPWVWNGLPFPALGRVGPADEGLVYQRVGQSNPRNAAAWQLGIGESINRYMKPTFLDGGVEPVTPAVAMGFVEGVWRGSITIPSSARWISLYATDGEGHVGVHAPVEFEVGNDLRIESYTLGSPFVGGGQMFSQQIIVTNPGPAASTDVQLRVVIPYHFEAILDVNGELRVSQGTAQVERAIGGAPPVVRARFGTLEAGQSATLDLRLLADRSSGGVPRTTRFVAEVTRAEPDPSGANNWVERVVEASEAAAAPLPGRIAWLRGEGDASDALGRLQTTNRGVSFVSRLDRQAFQFDGDGRIDIMASEDLVLRPGQSNALTVSLWMRTPPSTRTRMVLFETEADGSMPRWSLQLQEGLPMLVVGTVTRQARSTVRDMRDGRWHLISFQIALTPTPWIDIEVDWDLFGSSPAGLSVDVPIGGTGRAWLGGGADGGGFVGELDEVTVVRGIRRMATAGTLFRREFQAGGRGTAESVLETEIIRLGTDGQLASAVAGRPYTLTYRIRNTGWTNSGDVRAGLGLTGVGNVIRARRDGIDLPINPSIGGVTLPLGSIAAGGSTDLEVTLDRLADAVFTTALTPHGGPRDLAPALQRNIGVRADSDLDGMADDWERLRGLDPLNPADAFLDGDGDGYSNRAEFDAGTTPGDTTSHPRIEWMELGSEGVRLRVASRPEMDYVLERSVNLPAVESGWTPMERRRGTGGLLEFMTMPPEGAESLFYRLRPVPLW